jgi:hypothetical protein
MRISWLFLKFPLKYLGNRCGSPRSQAVNYLYPGPVHGASVIPMRQLENAINKLAPNKAPGPDENLKSGIEQKLLM